MRPASDWDQSASSISGVRLYVYFILPEKLTEKGLETNFYCINLIILCSEFNLVVYFVYYHLCCCFCFNKEFEFDNTMFVLIRQYFFTLKAIIVSPTRSSWGLPCFLPQKKKKTPCVRITPIDGQLTSKVAKFSFELNLSKFKL